MTSEHHQPDGVKIAQITGHIHKPVVLIGLMGSGKSTVGRRLAKMMGTGFVDSDQEIESAAQLSIPEIFERFGETHFRDGERRVIARLVEEGTGVIATGGGAFMDEETRALILESTIAVWLDCDIDTLVERTSRKDNRPLLKNGDPHEILSRLHREREPAYAQAQVRVKAEDGPHEDTAMQILEAIDAWL
ncbi:shikimate kinase [Altererythrobacter sp. ZODW24]|uniref:shikimate kinase n=1 Tax=Altererythrobacter sp. ZODW24 TaxID=2185142 RepID=UPI000DF857F9|nr:shikimate kinase [Altererythrobacter sp. ZODW24]